MRIAALLLVIAACQKSHEVALQLGPNASTITAGFLCREDADPTKQLVERARTGETYQLSVVIDIVDLGGRFPGCRGEEIVAACNTKPGTCSLVRRADNTRYCEPVTFTHDDVSSADLKPLLAKIRSQLQIDAVTLDAPSQPVLIRAVATTESCDALPDTFDAAKLVGCAYSCPVQLDGIDGPIALSLDTLDTACERQVIGCALFH